MTEYTVNGVLVTKYRTWAVSLIEREASGESLPVVSRQAWRELFEFNNDMSAKEALEIVMEARA